MITRKLTIFLVNCPRWDIKCPPYTTALLAGNLKEKGYNVYVKDLDVEFYHRISESDQKEWYPNESWQKWSEDGDLNKFNRFLLDYTPIIDSFVTDILMTKPDIVGFTIRPGSFLFSNEISKKIKKKSPNTYIVYGVPLKVQKDLNCIPHIDAISYGEADITFPLFLEFFDKSNKRANATPGFVIREKSGEIVSGGISKKIPDLTKIPNADYSFFDFSKYLKPNTIPTMFSRGCINRCSFCSAYGQYFRYRANDPAQTTAEIGNYIEHSNVQKPYHIYATDQLINGNLKSLEKLAKHFRDLPFKVTWEGMFSLRSKMTNEYIQELAKSGLVAVFVGLETASPYVLKLMKKKTNLNESKRIIKTLWQCGVFVHSSLVVGHPGESDEEFHRTIEFCKNMKKYMSGFTAAPLWLGDGHSDIAMNPEEYGVNLTHPMFWTADKGENTYEKRINRVEQLKQIYSKADWKSYHAQIRENRRIFRELY